MLTGNKDVDRKILNELEDVDLVRACQVNKQADKICKDQVFWMNRLFQRFPEVPGDVLRKNKGNRTWSDYYIHDLRKINKNNSEHYLIYGSINGRMDHILIALSLGANVHGENDDALRWASRNGHTETVKLLLDRGADIHARVDEALRWASYNGHTETVKLLLDRGAIIT